MKKRTIALLLVLAMLTTIPAYVERQHIFHSMGMWHLVPQLLTEATSMIA